MREPLVPNATTVKAMKEARRGGLKSFATEAIVLGFSTYTLGMILGIAWAYEESGKFWLWT